MIDVIVNTVSNGGIVFEMFDIAIAGFVDRRENGGISLGEVIVLDIWLKFKLQLI